MVVPMANLSAVVTGAVQAAMALSVEMLPSAVTLDAMLEAARASVAWFLRHLWVWLVGARAVAVENLPVAAAAAKRAAESAIEASEPWLQTAVKLLHGLCGWMLEASAMAVEKLSAAAAMAAKNAALSTVETSQPWLEMASKLLHFLTGGLVAASEVPVGRNLPEGAAVIATGGGAESTAEAYGPSLPTAGWFLHGNGVAVYVLLVLTLLAVAFLCGAVWAFTCRTMKGPGLGGARVPRAMFKASPRGYYRAVRTAQKARRAASGVEWMLFVAAPVVAYAAYLAVKTFY